MQFECNDIKLALNCSNQSDIIDISINKKFTVRNVISQVDPSIETVTLDVGDLKFKIDDFSIILINNQNLFILKNISQPNLKLLHFNCSKSSIWISVYAKDRLEFENNFIKIGQGYVMEANIIAEFTAKNKKGYELLSNIKHLEFEKNIHVQERICLVEHFVKDREPIILANKPINIGDLDSRNLVFPSDLPEEGKKLYDRIENLGNSDIDKKLIVDKCISIDIFVSTFYVSYKNTIISLRVRGERA